jgi:hypothetical protein
VNDLVTLADRHYFIMGFGFPSEENGIKVFNVNRPG